MGIDLRDFLRTLERESPESLLTIQREVALDYDITACAFELEKEGKTPVLVFERVKGYPHRIVTNVFAERKRYAQIFGVSEEAFIGEWISRSNALQEPVSLSQQLFQKGCIIIDSKPIDHLCTG